MNKGLISVVAMSVGFCSIEAYGQNHPECKSMEIIGGDCRGVDRCSTTKERVEISPSPSVGTVNKELVLNFRTYDIGMGDKVENSGASINWGDSSADTPISPLQSERWSIPHTYLTAGDYNVFAHFGVQFTYTGDGSCSYRCNVCASSKVTIN